MRTTPRHAAILALFMATVIAGPAFGRPFRVNQVPNGWVNGCMTCHEQDGAGGPRNAFGTTVEMSFLSTPGSTGTVLWGPALAALDSDGDGRSNGRELADPAGTWSPGQPHPGSAALVTLPGFANAFPAAVPALPPFGVAFLGLALGGIAFASLRKRRTHSLGFDT